MREMERKNITSNTSNEESNTTSNTSNEETNDNNIIENTSNSTPNITHDAVEVSEAVGVSEVEVSEAVGVSEVDNSEAVGVISKKELRNNILNKIANNCSVSSSSAEYFLDLVENYVNSTPNPRHLDDMLKEKEESEQIDIVNKLLELNGKKPISKIEEIKNSPFGEKIGCLVDTANSYLKSLKNLCEYGNVFDSCYEKNQIGSKYSNIESVEDLDNKLTQHLLNCNGNEYAVNALIKSVSKCNEKYPNESEFFVLSEKCDLNKEVKSIVEDPKSKLPDKVCYKDFVASYDRRFYLLKNNKIKKEEPTFDKKPESKKEEPKKEEPKKEEPKKAEPKKEETKKEPAPEASGLNILTIVLIILIAYFIYKKFKN
jgi:hypothetical protein